MSYLYFLLIIPIGFVIFFVFSAIYAKEDRSFRAASVLTYGVCNTDAIVAFSILFIIMTFTVIVLQLLAYSSLYDQTETCMPILYYFGSPNGCVKSIARTSNLQAQIYDVKKQLDQIQSYKTNEIQRTNYGGIESFSTKIHEGTDKFRHFVAEFYRLYYSMLQHGIIYIYKLYYDFTGYPLF